MLIDTHAHLSSPQVEDGLEGMLLRAKEAGVETLVNICTSLAEVERGLELAAKHSHIYLAAATTPHDVTKEGEEVFEQMASYAREGKLVAVGETGLEYHYFPETKQIQKAFLIRYLELAKECRLPVIIHCREGFTDLFEILDLHYKDYPGVLHCFTGTLEEAQEVLKRGWYLSFSGIVTFKKSVELQEVARLVPINQLLIETDTPYLAPTPYRGKQNEPAFLVHTARFLAELRGVSFEELAHQTSLNARSFYNLS